MASYRSKSPSTPSEGEIIESGSETKATTFKTSLNGTSVDRHTRASTSSAPRSRSPASLSSRSPRRRRSRTRTRSRSSRSRSRSPYRSYRGYKRRREDDYHDDRRYSRQEPPPRQRAGQRYDDRYYDRGQPHRRSNSYYDYDREEGYGGGLKYTDDYDRREEKRVRTRSRSPYRESYHEVRKPKQYSGDEWNESAGSRDFEIKGRRSSTEQLVSERGRIPTVAQVSKQDAETRENQMQQQTSDTNSRVVDRYVLIFSFRLVSRSLTNLVRPLNQYKKRRNSSLLRQSMKQLSWKLAGNDVRLLERNTRVRLHLYNCRHSMLEIPIPRHQAQILIVPVQVRLHQVSAFFLGR